MQILVNNNIDCMVLAHLPRICQVSPTKRQRLKWSFWTSSQVSIYHYLSNHSTIEASRESALPKDTASELASLFSTLSL